MQKKNKYDRDDTLIWVIVSLLGIVMFQMYFTLQFKEKIKEQDVVIKKLEQRKSDTSKIDSLNSEIRNLKEWISDEDERCAVQLGELQNKITQYEYDKNNSK